MNPNKAWERTFNAAITGLTSRDLHQDPPKVPEYIVETAKAIADRAVQYHILFAGTVNESLQSNLAPQLQEQQSQPYRSKR